MMSKVTMTDEQFAKFIKKHRARKNRHGKYVTPNGDVVASVFSVNGKRTITHIRIGI